VGCLVFLTRVKMGCSGIMEEKIWMVVECEVMRFMVVLSCSWSWLNVNQKFELS